LHRTATFTSSKVLELALDRLAPPLSPASLGKPSRRSSPRSTRRRPRPVQHHLRGWQGNRCPPTRGYDRLAAVILPGQGTLFILPPRLAPPRRRGQAKSSSSVGGVMESVQSARRASQRVWLASVTRLQRSTAWPHASAKVRSCSHVEHGLGGVHHLGLRRKVVGGRTTRHPDRGRVDQQLGPAGANLGPSGVSILVGQRRPRPRIARDHRPRVEARVA
jgi:hypothetical protein